MEISDKRALWRHGRRFVWMTLVIYAGLTLGYWIAHVAAPSVLWGDYDYLVGTSILGAVAFGGMYAAALALRPERPSKRQAAETR